MLRVAIVGCGKVADKHITQVMRLGGAQIVAVCDREELMASQLAERFGVPRAFSDVAELLTSCHPNIVHITTPPASHFAIAKQCMEAGCHVYVEKPFTVSAEEALQLVNISQSTGMKMTVGNETQFTPVACEMRRLVRSGYLGGPPVHMESIYCYEFGDERYARAVLGDRNHWVRKLPGGLLQNIISHGIGKIVEFMPGTPRLVLSHGFTSSFLKSMGETGIRDELRLILADDMQTTAYFTFSSQIRPALHQFRMCGPKNSLLADHDHQVLTRVPQNQKSYLNQFLPPFRLARQYAGGGRQNIRRFFTGELHAEAGINALIGQFYRAIAGDAELPIPYEDILKTATIMDRVFKSFKPGSNPGEDT
jgi:predicted dehydrogenase